MSSKYEKLIDLIVSEDKEQARALFHKIVVEQSRKIYEDLVNNEEGADEESEDTDFVSDINDDEKHIDGDEEGFGDDEVDSDDDDVEGDDDSDRLTKLEDAIEELTAQFDELMAQEEEEGHDFSESDDDSDSESVDAESDDESDDESVEDEDEDEDEDDEIKDEMVREYVERVTAPSNTEGQEVGSAGKSVSVNKRSNVAGKNDMGGSSKNLNRGGSEQVPAGPSAPTNAYTKGRGQLIGKVENSPGANTKGYTDKAKTTKAAK